MHRLTRKPVRAFTLLEMLIAALIMVVLLGASINLLRAGMGASSRTLTQGMVQEEARRVVEALARDIKDTGEQSSGWAVGENPDPPSQYYDQDVSKISFSRCVGYDPILEMLQWGPVVTYEYEPAVGDEPGKLVRTENGARVNVCDRVSAFVVHYVPDDSLVAITLTVELEDPGSPGHSIRAAYATSVRLRN